MRRGWHVVAGALLALGLAGVASAEVRIAVARNGQPTLDVSVIGGRIWTPVLHSPDELLNPGGDAVADGLPSHAVSRGTLAAAWLRGSTDELVVVLTTDGEVAAEAVLPAGRGVGTPALAPAGMSWLVAWQSAGDERGVNAAVLDATASVAAPTVTWQGTLVGVVRAGETPYLAWSDDTPLRTLWVAAFGPTPDNPVPIPIKNLLADVRTTPAATRLGATPIPAPWEPICLASGAEAAIVTWRDAPGETGFVELRDDGSTSGPDGLRGGPRDCSAVLRLVTQRR
jgi:hypothetical protein